MNLILTISRQSEIMSIELRLNIPVGAVVGVEHVGAIVGVEHVGAVVGVGHVGAVVGVGQPIEYK
jgi:hypothetical protein